MIHSFECLGHIRIKRLIESKKDSNTRNAQRTHTHTVQLNKSMCAPFFSLRLISFLFHAFSVVCLNAIPRSRPQITNRKYSHSVTNKFNAKRKSVWLGLTTRTFPKAAFTSIYYFPHLILGLSFFSFENLFAL